MYFGRIAAHRLRDSCITMKVLYCKISPVVGVHIAEVVCPHHRLHDAVSFDDGGEVPGGLLLIPGVGEGLHQVTHRLLVGKD